MEIQINLHVYAYFEEGDPKPTYRLWADDVLFGERDFNNDHSTYFIDELICLDLEPGHHYIKLEKVRPKNRGYIWYQTFNLMSESTDIFKEIPTNEIVLSNDYIIPFRINSLEELQNENNERND